jgi:hypothetical protein
LGLTKILTDAQRFVSSEAGRGEFLILKFDKCTNWHLIAKACRQLLGDTLYGSPGNNDPHNVNTATLQQLAGKVICAFMTPGYTLLSANDRVGITEIKNLYKPPSNYTPAGLDHPIIQYWGAGGTKINTKNDDQKIKENISTQKDILKKAAKGVKDKRHPITKAVQAHGCHPAHPDALGMMYWTTTGAFGNIWDRNERMWGHGKVGGLREIWKYGLEEYFQRALNHQNVPHTTTSVGALRKMFMPNIVMIDFSNENRCQQIKDLNNVASVALVEGGINTAWRDME